MMQAVNEFNAESPSVLTQAMQQTSLIDMQVIHLVQPDALSDKDMVTGDAYKRYARDLSALLLEDSNKLYPHSDSLLSDMTIDHHHKTLELYHLAGRFDRVTCRLLQSEDNARCFYVQTSFFYRDTLMTIAEQSAFLMK